MAITDASILCHVGLVLIFLWIFNFFNICYPVVYFLSFAYLYLVNESCSLKLRRRLQFEERKQANQKKLFSDSETVRWLNYAIEKIWHIFMEKIGSQKILLPIISWFLEKYKPWTVHKAFVQRLYLGKNPPLITQMRVQDQTKCDDHLALEFGLNFRAGDDMSTILGVRLRKRLGFGIRARMHVTGMHIEGKILVGVKFIKQWPFVDRVRLCFLEPPYFQMMVKPIFNHGIDVTEIPGISGWLDKILSVAFEQTLIEPNMLLVDVGRLISASSESWFYIDEKSPIAFAKVEIMEAVDVQPSDFNGFTDLYVRGHLGSYRFQTKMQRKTLKPKCLEEFKMPISSWDSPNLLFLEVHDKDHLLDTRGNCFVDIGSLRDGLKHEKWVSLKNIKTGRLRIYITVVENFSSQPLPIKGVSNLTKGREVPPPALELKESTSFLDPRFQRYNNDEIHCARSVVQLQKSGATNDEHRYKIRRHFTVGRRMRNMNSRLHRRRINLVPENIKESFPVASPKQVMIEEKETCDTFEEENKSESEETQYPGKGHLKKKVKNIMKHAYSSTARILTTKEHVKSNGNK